MPDGPRNAGERATAHRQIIGETAAALAPMCHNHNGYTVLLGCLRHRGQHGSDLIVPMGVSPTPQE